MIILLSCNDRSNELQLYVVIKLPVVSISLKIILYNICTVRSLMAVGH